MKPELTKFTELSPHLHYSTSSSHMAFHLATLCGEPYSIVLIMTIEAFDWQLHQWGSHSFELLGWK